MCCCCYFSSFDNKYFRVIAAIFPGSIEISKKQDVDSSVINDEKSWFHLSLTAELLGHIPYLPSLCVG